MGIAVILTYRCNAKCSMCNIWKSPSLPEEEISLFALAKLPDGQNTINLTGGEPTLRHDLMEIVDLLYPKTKTLEISSNGLLARKLEPIIQKYPNIKIRFSLDGTEQNNDLIRGEKSGYKTKVAGLLKLKELGGTDLGFAVTIQDENAADLLDLFRLAEKHGFELSTSTLHNGFQFHKADNSPYDRLAIARQIEKLIVAQLRTNKVKNWFRAYLGLGLIARVLGNPRILPCTAGTDAAFVDPWGGVYACNVRPDLFMGNLNEQSWAEIMESPLASQVRAKVARCAQNCWMVGSAKPAIAHPKFKKLPRWKPFIWVLENKIRVSLGLDIQFSRYINYAYPIESAPTQKRNSYLGKIVQRSPKKATDPHYQDDGEYLNQ